MNPFHPPVPADREWADAPLAAAGRRGCEYSLSCAAMWQHVYRLDVALVDGCFTVRSLKDGAPAYLFPAGAGSPAPALAALESLSRAEGAPLRFYSLTGGDRAALETLYPRRFTFSPLDGAAEYLYASESLCTLAGKKLHAKRNHVNRFRAAHPDWSFEPITPENLYECREMNARWLLAQEDGGSGLFGETQAVGRMLGDFFAFGMTGGLLRAGGRVVAYAAGERLGGGRGDTFDVRVEKAFADVPGAYAAVNQAFAQSFCGECAYINREDDAGDEGLRKAKLSYRPAMLLEKFSATEGTT